MSHHFHLHTSLLSLPFFFPSGFHARLSPSDPRQLASGSGSSSGVVAVASPSRTVQAPHRAKAKAEAEAREQEMAQGKAALGWAARDASGVLSPYDFSRRYVRACACLGSRHPLSRPVRRSAC